MMENGCRIDDPATIRQQFVEHFQSVLGSSMQEQAAVEFNMDGLVWSFEHLDILNNRITHEVFFLVWSSEHLALVLC